MAKIMLVEDDNNLREIYEARLLAEGYEIVSAHDGEEALALAVKERPDLVISDVMMPKISGFDMLDILRGTPETANTKVIMMTALSQSEDKDRADKLGADRYLVKSQVTLEDVARVAREVLEGTGNKDGTPSMPPATELPAVPAPTAPPSPDPVAAAMPVAAPVQPVVSPPVVEPPASVVQVPVAAPTPTEPALASVAPMPSTMPDPAPVTEPPAASADPVSDPAPSIQLPEPPAADPTTSAPLDTAQTVAAEEQAVEQQVESFVETGTVEPPAISIGTDGTVSAADPSQAPSEETSPPPADLKLPTAWTMPQPGTESTSPASEPAPETAATETAGSETPDAPQSDLGTTQKKVIQPLHDVTTGPDLNALLAKEEEKEQVAQIIGNAGVAPPQPMPPQPGQTNHPSDDSKPQDPSMMAL